MISSGYKDSGKQKAFTDTEKQRDTRLTNILAAKGIADVVRTSLGPRGMDKMVSAGINGRSKIQNQKF